MTGSAKQSRAPDETATGLLRRCAPRNGDLLQAIGSSLGEIQLHADTVGIVEKELRIAGARHDALAEFHVFGLQALAHAFYIGRRKGDMVEAAGVLVFLLGAAHHDALARFARAHP